MDKQPDFSQKGGNEILIRSVALTMLSYGFLVEHLQLEYIISKIIYIINLYLFNNIKICS